MDDSDDNEVYVNLLPQSPDNQIESSIMDTQNEQISEATLNADCMKQDTHKLNNAMWTTHATSILLKLYEENLERLQTPKKKTKIWIAISDNLEKYYDIHVTANQVRWKINALTKKYKHCIDIGKHEKFKYFKEMDKIYAKYNVDCDSYSITEFLYKKKTNEESISDFIRKPIPETRAMIEMRKARLASRINCDRFQGKIKLERQWLQYLYRQEEQKQFRDKIFERNLKLREEKLETMKKELELKESLEYRKLQLMEKEQEKFLHVEREKLELLKQMFQ